MTYPKPVALTPKEVQALMERVERRQLSDSDFEVVCRIVRLVLWIPRALREGKISISRLRSLTGIKD